MYQSGETIRLIASITDVSGTAADPTTVKISINTPASVVAIDSVDTIKVGVGNYYYDYTIPADTGTYQYNIVATGAEGRITLVRDSFVVQKAI